MFTHSEQRALPYSAEQMFDLVADVERYPEFLPWCLAARIRKNEDATLIADMVIGFRMIRERFSSRVTLDRPNLRIDVEYTEGPFKFLRNHWIFVPSEGGAGCNVQFHVEFEFRSAMLQKLMGVVFHEAVRRMVAAFESRAKQLYGGGKQAKSVPV